MRKHTISRTLVLGIILLLGFVKVHAQDPNVKSFIILGDTHWDKWEDHDSTWLVTTHPDDYRQSQGYSANTRANFDPIITEVLAQSKKTELNVKGIVQLGDLVEGLAGTSALALKMENDGINALRASEFSAPWIVTKGNHDITGPGAPEAYASAMFAFQQAQLKQPITKTYYSYTVGDVKFIVLDCYDSNLLTFLEQELNTTAKFKIICTHMPVIPVTGRLWHIYQTDDAKREQLLNLIAKNKAIVLCGHLHKYSYVRRMTPSGPIDQIMVSTVMTNSGVHAPTQISTTYGPDLVDLEPSFDPTTQQTRRDFLTKEAPFIKSFWMDEMPGYSILALNSETGKITLKSYAGLGQVQYGNDFTFSALYTLKTNKVGNGSIKVSPADTVFNEGTSVSLSATGDLGWKFSGWSGDLYGTANPDSVTMDANKSITATFTQIPAGQYELRTSVEGTGKIEVSPAGPYYSAGTSVTLKAVADPDYRFTGWSGDLSGDIGTQTITMDAHKQVKAIFAKKSYYKVSTGKPNHGTINITPAGSSYLENTIVTITAVPESGWEFTGWTGDKNGSVNPDTLMLTSDKEVKALFKMTGGGMISIKPSDDSYVKGGLIYADKNFNSDTSLVVREGSSDSYRSRAYLKFNLRQLKGNVLSANLKLKVKKTGLPDGTPAKAYVYLVTNDSWKENTLTWKNVPASDAAIIDSCALISKTDYEYSWEVTDKVKQELVSDSTLSIMLKDKTQSNRTVSFFRKDDLNSQPELIVITDQAMSVKPANGLTPRDYVLKQNYPNPFNPSTLISYSLPKAGNIKLRIYDVMGKEVAILAEGYQPAGEYSVTFQAKDKMGHALSSGTYFCTLETSGYSKSIKMILLR